MSLLGTLPVPATRRFLSTGDVQLHLVEAGPPSGPPVLLLHGFPEFWYGWRHQIPALARAGFRVIVPDQRGYNRSEAPQAVRAYDLDRLTADVLHILGAYGYERAHVVGHDWGAVVAWTLGATAPHRLASLSILNVPHPAVFRRTLFTDWEQMKRSWYIAFFQIPGLPEWLLGRDDFGGLVRMMKGSSHRSTFTADDLAAYRTAWAHPGRLRGMIHWYRAAARRALRGSLPTGRIRVPTQVLWGEQDVALRATMAAPSVEQCDAPRRLLRYPSATHWLQHDEPAAVSERLVEWAVNSEPKK